MKEITRHFRTTLTIAIFILAISAINAAAAAFTVTNTNDSGAGSLRDAIGQANTNAQADTINFDPAVFNVARTITLTSGQINITADDQIQNGQTGRLVTINGPGANLLTISGNNASRIFSTGIVGQAQQNANITMNGMTLRDGSSDIGGAIFVNEAASFILNSMIIRNNIVSGSNSSGGAIFSNFSRNIVINDSLITENSAHNNGGMDLSFDGGSFVMRNTIISNNRANTGMTGGIGIFRGNIDIKNSQITGNTSFKAVGGMNFFQSVINISDTVISNNTAGYGAGGMSMDTENATLRKVTISNNTAGFALAGGISIRNPGGFVTIIDSTVSNNVVAVLPGMSDSDGGGIYIGFSTDGTVKIINTTISGNSAGRRGGGILNFAQGSELINSTVVNNSAGSGGGGIADAAAAEGFAYRPKLQNSIIAGNTAAIGPDLYSGFDSAGYNIIGNTANTNNSTANTGDQFNVNPNVGALANNGGPTRTHALLAGSPAINAGSNALAVDQSGNPLQYDQRGACFNRIVGGTVDIGAFEVGATGNCNTSAVLFDFDGDRRADISVFRPSNRVWYLNRSTDGFTSFQFGLASDKLAPADYDGDKKTDVAVWREADGDFYIVNSSDNSVRKENFGLPGDKLTVGDWDGDGKADLSVYRGGAGQGVFYYRGTKDNPNRNITSIPFGAAGDLPVRGDFDGDGKQDAAVFRPSNGVWYVLRSSDAKPYIVQFGQAGDKLVPADYDGDGKTDVAVYRNGIWYILQTSNNQVRFVSFGVATDKPAPADYDGDGKADETVYRNGVWYVLQSGTGTAKVIGFGLAEDAPLPNAFVNP